jgi:hypothetical protein
MYMHIFVFFSFVFVFCSDLSFLTSPFCRFENSWWWFSDYGAAGGSDGSAMLMMEFGACWCQIWCVGVPELPELVWW